MKNWFKSLIILTLITTITLGGCQQLNANSPDNSNQAQNNTTENINQKLNLPRLEGKAKVSMTIKGETILIEIDGDNAPLTAGNFVDLVNRGVYNGLAFHRVVKDPQPFVAQGGDPQSKDPNVPVARLGTGGFTDPDTQIQRYIPLEIRPKYDEDKEQQTITYSKTISETPQLKHERGAIAMARSQAPDSASSQFYFALAELPFLDGNYAVFGYVLDDGMKVVDKIQQGDRIDSAKVIEGIDNLKK